MIRDEIHATIKDVIKQLYRIEELDFVVERPRDAGNGDFATNAAMVLAQRQEKKPRVVATELISGLSMAKGLEEYGLHVSIAGPGFINFRIADAYLREQINVIRAGGENYGRNTSGNGEKINVEFISANPTGPLTLPNGRGGYMGDCLASVLAWNGYEVGREYYLNDEGNQVRLLGASALAAIGAAEKQKNHYQGAYVAAWAAAHQSAISGLDVLTVGRRFVDDLLTTEVKPAVEQMGICFDTYFHESALHESGEIEKAWERLGEYVYEKDGALWFMASQFGDEKDRVLRTSVGSEGGQRPTYFCVDIAYHLNKLARGYTQWINFWGADHHGDIARVKGALDALGHKGKLHIVLMQLVTLMENGHEVRMSKRAGKFVLMKDLIEAVGPDVARFFFLMVPASTHMTFDLGLAKEQSEKNPVFYVQYAYARMCSMLRKIGGQAADERGENYWGNERERLSDVPLKEKTAFDLARVLLQFPEIVYDVGRNYNVHELTTYATQLADALHRFYDNCRVMDEGVLHVRRKELVEAARIVLGNCLSVMGVSAPEKM